MAQDTHNHSYIEQFSDLIKTHPTSSIIIFLGLTILLSTYLARAKRPSVRNACITATNSFFSLLLHLSGVIWASSVSIYNLELKAQVVSRTTSLTTIGFVFLLANAIAIILLTMRNRGEKIKSYIEKSLPPTEVITFNAEKYQEHLMIYRNTATTKYKLELDSIETESIFKNRQRVAIETLASHAKVVISGIIDIANSWTKQRYGDLKYSANIFSVIDKNGYDLHSEPELMQAIVESPFFLYTDTLESRLYYCDKLIISQQEFSTCNQKKEAQGIPLVLPYSENNGLGKKCHPNFEGAPKAIELRQAQYLADTKKITDLFFKQILNTNHEPYITEYYKKKLHQYYKDDNTCSLLSIPMYSYDKKDVFAIFNIYSDTPDMLYSKERALAFYQFIRPHIAILEFIIQTQIRIASLRVPIKEKNQKICWQQKFATPTTVNYNINK
ncbi:hypothetical protein [Aeromonas dhakensis]|uniref:hypothetical protein n=1 Tax=Aeromonas dhakensis TaxID=196024 RepID=UPI003B9DC7FB